MNNYVDELFNSENTPEAFKELYPRMLKDKKGTIGRLRPWAFWVEITRGCNLSCGHCATRLFEKGKYEFMTVETWRNLLNIIKEIAPYSRLEIGNAGEPTLHPQFLEFMRIAREECPTIQLLTFTNGTQLLAGKITYKDMFDAGLNMVFLDMYGPREKHIELAKKSTAIWFEQAKKEKDAPNVFKYHNDPNIRILMLADAPHKWPKKKVSRGAFSTFQNNLDWDAAKKFGLSPITEAPNRRCDLPAKFPTIYFDGSYSFCCFDFMREVAGQLGNVSSGIDGFFKYWVGEYMQDMRRRLHNKDRKSHPMCSKCAFTSIRCDIAWWPENILNNYYNGDWKELGEYIPPVLNPRKKNKLKRFIKKK